MALLFGFFVVLLEEGPRGEADGEADFRVRPGTIDLLANLRLQSVGKLHAHRLGHVQSGHEEEVVVAEGEKAPLLPEIAAEHVEGEPAQFHQFPVAVRSLVLLVDIERDEVARGHAVGVAGSQEAFRLFGRSEHIFCPASLAGILSKGGEGQQMAFEMDETLFTVDSGQLQDGRYRLSFDVNLDVRLDEIPSVLPGYDVVEPVSHLIGVARLELGDEFLFGEFLATQEIVPVEEKECLFAVVIGVDPDVAVVYLSMSMEEDRRKKKDRDRQKEGENQQGDHPSAIEPSGGVYQGKQNVVHLLNIDKILYT